MKRVLAVALVLCLIVLLSGCGNAPKSRDLQEIWQGMLKADMLPEMVAVPHDLALDFYGIEPEWYEEALFMVASDSLLADEVVMVRARDDDAAGQIHRMLESRMDAKAAEARTYSPEQYAVISRGHVLKNGRELALLVSPKADTLLEIYQGE
ncbi:MAG: DUF4358 domain-containing protein [Eubacteriales bacterium]|nr:DUF4358 domain-containing protein [Eubacteriales bacterium]